MKRRIHRGRTQQPRSAHESRADVNLKPSLRVCVLEAPAWGLQARNNQARAARQPHHPSQPSSAQLSSAQLGSAERMTAVMVNTGLYRTTLKRKREALAHCRLEAEERVCGSGVSTAPAGVARRWESEIASQQRNLEGANQRRCAGSCAQKECAQQLRTHEARQPAHCTTHEPQPEFEARGAAGAGAAAAA